MQCVAIGTAVFHSPWVMRLHISEVNQLRKNVSVDRDGASVITSVCGPSFDPLADVDPTACELEAGSDEVISWK